MAQPLITIDVTQIEALAERVLRLDSSLLGQVALRSVNRTAQAGFKEAKRQMLSGVNLSQRYVDERMDVEEATDPQNPVATIIAFRPGGKRRPATKPVNLRQYDPQIKRQPNNWTNDGALRRTGAQVFRPTKGSPASGGVGPKPKGRSFYENPRKPGTSLPFYPRIGNSVLGIPAGQKVQSISVEVTRGQRKALRSRNGFKPFMQRMPNGEILVMRRVSKGGGKGNKGKIESLHSLSVWQLFNFNKAKVIPLIAQDLQNTVMDELGAELDKVFAT